MFLKNLNQQELKVQLAGTFYTMQQHLTPEQRAQVNLNQLTQDAHNFLNGRLTISEEAIPDARSRIRSAGECAANIVMAVVDGVAVALSLAGLSMGVGKSIVRSLLAEMAPAEVRALFVIVQGLKASSSAVETMGAVVKLIQGLFNLVGIKAFLKALWRSLSWYHYFLVAGTVVAQIIAWGATGGLALIASAALVGVALYSFVTDVIACVKTCGTVHDTRSNEERALGNTLVMGQRLNLQERLTSLNGEYYLILEEGKNLSIYAENNINSVWSSGATNADPGQKVVSAGVSELGFFSLFNEKGQSLWAVPSSAYGPGCYLMLQDSGKLAFCDIGNQIRWQS